MDFINNNTLKEVTIEERINMMKRHLEMLIEDKNEKAAMLEIRSHLLYYFKAMPDSKKIKNSICSAKSKQELLNILDNYLIDNK